MGGDHLCRRCGPESQNPLEHSVQSAILLLLCLSCDYDVVQIRLDIRNACNHAVDDPLECYRCGFNARGQSIVLEPILVRVDGEEFLRCFFNFDLKVACGSILAVNLAFGRELLSL